MPYTNSDIATIDAVLWVDSFNYSNSEIATIDVAMLLSGTLVNSNISTTDVNLIAPSNPAWYLMRNGQLIPANMLTAAEVAALS